MRTLLVEDDGNKAHSIVEFMKVQSRGDATVTVRRSYHTGLVALLDESYDLLLLDMTLPMYDLSRTEDGFRVDPFAGRDLLDEMKRKGVRVPTVVMTQYRTLGEGHRAMTIEALDRFLTTAFAANYLGYVFYSSSETRWQSDLVALLEAHAIDTAAR